MDVGELPAEQTVPRATRSTTPVLAVDQEIPPVDRDLRLVWRLLGVTVVTACCLVVLAQLHVSLILRDTTANGGDLGAHVWFPAYLRDHLLPSGRIAGWSNDWFGGFPAGQFYFPLPALVTVALDLVLPYNIAFKIVSVSGIVAMPVAAYALGRGLGARRPTPELFAVATSIFLFFKGIDVLANSTDSTIQFNQRIMGGTMVSTMAGEFSFSIALALALFFLASLAYSLRTRRRLWLPAVLLAAVVLSHIVVAIFAAVGGVVLFLFALGSRRSRNLVTLGIAGAVGAVGFLLTAMWSVPLVADFGLTANMRYEKLTSYGAYLFPHDFRWVFVLAGIALVIAFVRFDRATLSIAAITLMFAVFFRFWPELHVWNLRFLPFWYLGAFLVAACGVGELVNIAARGSGALSHALAAAPSDGFQDVGPPGSMGDTGEIERRSYRLTTTVVATVLVAVLTIAGLAYSASTRGFVSDWARWNFSGYQATSTSPTQPKSYPEYSRLIDTMRRLPPGRALWEGGESLNYYGTPLALMLLPYWTHGRIGSMEGLYYESAASTPYTFMMIAPLSGTTAGKSNASNPVRGLDYRGIADFDLGVRYMKLSGVRYYMAYSDDAKAHADANPGLREVATVPDVDGKYPPHGWKVYEVRGHATVAPLQYQPLVVEHPKAERQAQCFGRAPSSAEQNPKLGAWECAAAGWWNTPGALNQPFAAGGPPSWQRAPQSQLSTATQRRLPKVEVSDIHQDESSISFKVSRTGVPVVVRTSYYPNWKATGADGPWRLSPNEMVVVPTSKTVSMHYAWSGSEWVGIVLSVLGLSRWACSCGGVGGFALGAVASETGSSEPFR